MENTIEVTADGYGVVINGEVFDFINPKGETSEERIASHRRMQAVLLSLTEDEQKRVSRIRIQARWDYESRPIV
jgi:hypothetical protein